jgi:hypothetical protein
MKAVLSPMLLLVALSVPALAQNNQGQNNNNQGHHVRGAPGPLMAAGLPVLLIGGGIVYWIVRRKKRASSFKSREDAVAKLKKDGFAPIMSTTPDTFLRIRNNIKTCVCVGKCRTGEYLISAAAPPRVVVTGCTPSTKPNHPTSHMLQIPSSVFLHRQPSR